MVPVSAIIRACEVRRYLQHVGEDPDPPERAPPSHQQMGPGFDEEFYDPAESDLPTISYDE